MPSGISKLLILPNEDFTDNIERVSSLLEDKLFKWTPLEAVWDSGRESMNGLLIIVFMYLVFTTFKNISTDFPFEPFTLFWGKRMVEWFLSMWSSIVLSSVEHQNWEQVSYGYVEGHTIMQYECSSSRACVVFFLDAFRCYLQSVSNHVLMARISYCINHVPCLHSCIELSPLYFLVSIVSF